MASAALNSGLLEALVSRGVHADTHPTSTRGSNLSTNSPPSPVVAVNHHSYLDHPQYSSSFNHQYMGGTDPVDNSTSGGDATTEDDEASISEQSGYSYKRQLGLDQLCDNSKKRRKQSKPTRISGTDGESNGHPETANGKLEEGERYYESENMSSHRQENDENNSGRCPHCHISFPTDDALRRHMIEEHIGRLLSEDEARHQQYQHQLNLASQYHMNHQSHKLHSADPELEEGETIPLNLTSPRWENRPPSNIRDEEQKSPNRLISLPASIPIPPSFSDGKLNMPGIFSFGPPPFLLPFLHQGERERGVLPGSANGSNGQSRIFNPEAYCDLCNKEFCNKYFLKTHKANKHGIYTPEIGGSPLGCTPLIPNTSLSTNSFNSTPLSSSSLSSTPISCPISIPPVTTSPTVSTPISGPPFAAAFVTANVNALPLRPLLPPQIQSNPKSLPSPLKNEPGSSKPSGVINFEAYCELCQKEFCNKYFLKRHKSKIHGINIDVSCKPTKQTVSRLYTDRPEGWCDACQKDVGGRIKLNSHKMHVHGPHIVMPLSSPQNQNQIIYPGEVHNPVSHHSNEFLKDERDRRELQNNFSPWDVVREPTNEYNSDNQRFSIDSSIISEESRSENKNYIEKDNQTIDSQRKSENETEKCNWDQRSTTPVSRMQGDMTPNEFSNSWNIKEEPENHSDNIESVQNNHSQDDQTNERKPTSPNHLDINVAYSSASTTDFPLSTSDIENIRSQNKDSQSLPDHKGNEDSIIHMNYSEHKLDQVIEDQCHDKGSHLMTDISNDLSQQNENSNIRDSTVDAPTTPGGGSSTDESSRETGLIARVGQPAMVQAPPGTKFTADQLRQLGVINPDAFCELCCKEFCNKYFLRTHRIKKHGIYTPEYSERSRQSKDVNAINLARILERQAMDIRPVMPDIEGPLECDVCRKQCPNPYVLQMHKYYYHGPGQEILHQEPPMHIYAPQPSPQEQLRQLALQAHQNHQHQIRKHQQHRLQQQKRLNLMQPQHPLTSKQEENGKGEINGEKHDHNRSSVDLQSQDEELASVPNRLAVVDFAGSSEDSPGATGEADTSEDLRKLQSMIFQLNKQGDKNTRCRVCGKDVNNKYLLRAHLMTEHGISSPQEEPSTPSDLCHTPKSPRDSSTPVSPSPTTPLSGDVSNTQGFCSLCKKDFFSRYILQQHLLSTHGIFTPPTAQTSFMDRIRAEVENRDDRKPLSTSRSYCEICNKELCNKYFMKTHMAKMHGINIENGTSGGVTCEICNKELCSKYFLRVHKQNSHGLVEEMREGEEQQIEDFREIEICPLCSRKFRNVKWLKTHLTSDHGQEGKEKWKDIAETLPNPESAHSISVHVCNICGDQMPDPVSLQIHVIKQHNQDSTSELSQIQEQNDESKPTLSCSLCPFSCKNITLLLAHERSHGHTMHPLHSSPLLPSSQEYPCPFCSQIMPSLEIYQQHLLQHQLQGILKPFFDRENREQLENLSHQDIFNSSIEQTKESDISNYEENITGDNLENSTKKSSKLKKRWKCTECNRKFKKRADCLTHVHACHNPRAKGIWLGRSTIQRRLYKCRKCGTVAHKLGALKQHIQRSHTSGSGSSGVPTVHAEPSAPTTSGRFVMQPFLLNKDEKQTFQGENADGEHFVPSLVYLPVSRKVQRPLVVSFCLTPA